MYCIVLSLIQGYFKSSCGDVSRHTGLGTSAASPPRMGRHSHTVRSDPKWIQSNKVKWQVKWPVKWHERLPQSSLSISSFWMISGIAWAKWAKNQIFRWYRDSAAGGCLQGCATKVGVKLLGTMMDNVEIWRFKTFKTRCNMLSFDRSKKSRDRLSRPLTSWAHWRPLFPTRFGCRTYKWISRELIENSDLFLLSTVVNCQQLCPRCHIWSIRCQQDPSLEVLGP